MTAAGLYLGWRGRGDANARHHAQHRHPGVQRSAADRFGMERLCQAAEGGAFDPRSTEIIVVDDGSKDDTGERAEKALRTLPHVTVLRLATKFGEGAPPLRAGVASATGLSVAFTDADTAIDPSQFAELSAALRESDIAIGSRL